MVYLDLSLVADRLGLIEAVSKVLALGSNSSNEGLAFVPTTWCYKPLDFEGEGEKGPQIYRLLNDVVMVDEKEVPLEEYLTETFPMFFSLEKYGPLEILVIKYWKRLKGWVDSFDSKGNPTVKEIVDPFIFKMPDLVPEVVEEYDLKKQTESLDYPFSPVKLRWKPAAEA